MKATFSFTVSKKQANTHLLVCLYPAIPYLQPEQWRGLLAGQQGSIQVDGITVHQDVELLFGQVVNYSMDDYHEAEVDSRWSLVWSNNEIAAIHKPANLPVNRTTRNVYNTLIQLLRRESPWPNAHLLHRLDLETSGVILIAQNNDIARRYQSKLGELITRKIYRAVVVGKPSWQEKDFSCDLSTLDESNGGTKIRSQMHVVPTGEGKTSRTQFRVLSTADKTLETSAKITYSLIECEIFTGRKHQIRAQLAHLNHPIIGDKIYNNHGEFYLKRLAKTLSAVDHEKLLTSHHLLHAYEIHLHNLLREGNKEAQEIILRDEEFPESWQGFSF
jgi:23S rRNA pseudouridine1911/1915/1917 synthase